MRKAATLILFPFLLLWTAKVSGQNLSAEQQEAVEIIKTLEGSINTAKDAKGSTVYNVDFRNSGLLLDADLAFVKRLPQLHSLILSFTHISDRGLEHLREQSQLRELY